MECVGSGPSQAERVLDQSPMLEQAHERRFVVGELSLDIAGFEAEHSQRIRETLDRLQSHFDLHRISSECTSLVPADISLTDLVSGREPISFPSDFEIETNRVPMPTEPSLVKTEQCVPPFNILPDEDVEHLFPSADLIRAGHHARQQLAGSVGPRQRKPIRIRRGPICCTERHVTSRNRKVQTQKVR